MTEPLLSARGVVAGYAAADMILKGVDLDVHPGEVVAIIGPNGAGKSTLLKAIAGILTPSAGAITLDGAAIAGHPPREIAARGLAFVPQEQNVFPTMSVRENLEMGTWTFRRDRARVRSALESALAAAPLLARFAGRAAGELSGGQQRLLEIERALLCDPTLLLVDEPTVGLDPKTAAMIYRRLRALAVEQGRTILLVDQNIIAGTEIADHVYVIELGATKLGADKAEFDARYRNTIDEWLI